MWDKELGARMRTGSRGTDEDMVRLWSRKHRRIATNGLKV